MRLGHSSFHLLLVLVLCCTIGDTVTAQLPPGVVDTQPNGDAPPSPTESLSKITVPEGFHVSLFAGEPDVHQPIAMEFDDRGRLWVVECFSYPAWRDEGKDRILIFEDTDNDGRFDKRKVFADKLSNVTGLALGFGGAWVCSAPNFIFIADRDANDVPDGPPKIKLDGWNDNDNSVKHNVYNGMKWGPDGWLYGGHGILDNSLIGKPGTPPELRQKMNCGIWRYHPVRDVFEIVAHGATNPWGIDFDELGQGFFTNSVIGHFWHLIPGARYRRMYGSHFNPYTYTLVEQCADHFHWGEGRWTESRGGVGSHGEAGGGHAHVGALIYQGGRWPAEYHGTLFTANLHGNRLNRDYLKRKGSGYVALHGPDFLHGNDPWFRGIGIKCGPDGNVMVSDWTDLGECHDNDGTHRSSGRIYKVSFGPPEKTTSFDLANATNDELLAYIDHPNKWFWERARRLLHERATAKHDVDAVSQAAQARLLQEEDVSKKLRLLSLVALLGTADEAFCQRMCMDADEYVQAWAVRHMAQETIPSVASVRQFLLLARTTNSLRVRLELSAALQRISLNGKSGRWELAEALLMHFPATEDQNLLPMTWFGIEPLASLNPGRFLALATLGEDTEQLADIREFVVRRLLADEKKPQARINEILQFSTQLKDPSAADVLAGLVAAFDGRTLPARPEAWLGWLDTAKRRKNFGELRTDILSLGVRFRDDDSIRQLQSIASNRSEDIELRKTAVRNLADSKTPGTRTLLLNLLSDSTLRRTAINRLRAFNHADVATTLIQGFSTYSVADQLAVMGTLTSSPAHTKLLLASIEQGNIPVNAIKPTHAAAISRMKDVGIRKSLSELWGDVRSTPREARQKIANWKALLASRKLSKPNLEAGKKLYAENCGKCHKLFGEGGEVGPELTGADRRNLDYLLENVISPSAVVAKNYRLHSVVMLDGRVISGAILEETRATIVLQTVEKRETISRSEIDTIEATEMSLMPAGQFDVLSHEQVRDLVAYLRS